MGELLQSNLSAVESNTVAAVSECVQQSLGALEPQLAAAAAPPAFSLEDIQLMHDAAVAQTRDAVSSMEGRLRDTVGVDELLQLISAVEFKTVTAVSQCVQQSVGALEPQLASSATPPFSLEDIQRLLDASSAQTRDVVKSMGDRMRSLVQINELLQSNLSAVELKTVAAVSECVQQSIGALGPQLAAAAAPPAFSLDDIQRLHDASVTHSRDAVSSMEGRMRDTVGADELLSSIQVMEFKTVTAVSQCVSKSVKDEVSKSLKDEVRAASVFQQERLDHIADTLDSLKAQFEAGS